LLEKRDARQRVIKLPGDEQSAVEKLEPLLHIADPDEG
jgi:hypothetical protein